MSKAVLVLIDVQKGFNDSYWGKRNNPDFEINISSLLSKWRVSKRPVIHIQHLSTEILSPLRPDRPGVQFMDCVQPLVNEVIFQKSVNSAFIGTGLEQHLRNIDADELIFAGLTTDHCVSTSVRMAKNLGFNPIIASNACVTHDRKLPGGTVFEAELVHQVSLASLNTEFALVRTVGEIISKFCPEVYTETTQTMAFI